jgi:chromosome segregation protein
VQKKEIEIELNASAPGLDIKTINKELLEKEADLQDIERGILDIRGEKERIRTAIENSEDEKELAQFDNEITALKTELSMLETKLKGEEGIILQERLNAIKTTKGQLSTELKELSGNIKELEKRVKQNKKLLAEKEEKIKDASRALEALYAELKQIQGQIDGIHVERGKIERKVERLKEDLIRSETLKEGVEKSLSDLKYEADFYKDVTPIDAKRDELEKRANEIELELQSLGSVNMKAPEIYEEKLKDYNEIKEKVSILTHEREAVLKMIEEVETRKKDVFLKAFTAINNHFKDLAGGVFSNEVTLKLENEIDPFDGGLDIIMKVGKKERNVELMSGGEKSLLTILFVFSIHMYKPSHFYILDEVEAALDKENSKKFSELIKQISKTTQFIVVSHNDTVIVAADTALGVTKTKNGSRIVSIKLTAN